MNKNAFQAQDSLLFLSNRVGRLLANRMRKNPAMEAHALIPPDVAILADLWTQDGLRQQELAVSKIKDKAAISRMLDRLEEKEIVLRRADEADKRMKRIYLTPKGYALQKEIWAEAEQLVENTTAHIPRKDLEKCKKVLLSIYKQLINN